MKKEDIQALALLLSISNRVKYENASLYFGFLISAVKEFFNGFVVVDFDITKCIVVYA